MKEIFEPYAGRFLFESTTPRSADDWGQLLIEFAGALASEIIQAGPCMIGHLKGYAHAQDLGFLKISSIGAQHRADISGDWKGYGKKLSLDLNVLVYGLGRNVLSGCTQKTIAAIGKSRHCVVLEQTVDARSLDCRGHPKGNRPIEDL